MMATRTVLVVDDDPNIRRMLQDILQDEGYQVRVAANGREALDDVATVSPDLILLDLMMPVLDGRGFYREFSAQYHDGDRAPVLVISADQGVREQARALGVDGYLTKPFDIDELLDQVARLMQ